MRAQQTDGASSQAFAEGVAPTWEAPPTTIITLDAVCRGHFRKYAVLRDVCKAYTALRAAGGGGRPRGTRAR